MNLQTGTSWGRRPDETFDRWDPTRKMGWRIETGMADLPEVFIVRWRQDTESGLLLVQWRVLVYLCTERNQLIMTMHNGFPIGIRDNRRGQRLPLPAYDQAFTDRRTANRRIKGFVTKDKWKPLMLERRLSGRLT